MNREQALINTAKFSGLDLGKSIVRSMSTPSIHQEVTPPLIRRLRARFTQHEKNIDVVKPERIIVGFELSHAVTPKNEVQ